MMTLDQSKIKEGMMELWNKIFHDSKEFISLIFDNYFERGIHVCHIDNNRVVASILGIPYDFYYGNKKLKGLYLCGIATDFKYRRKGLMTSLLKEIEEKSKEDFDFLFLIPSDEAKRIIYSEKGYYNAIYKVHEFYTSVHDFDIEFQSTLYNFDSHIRKLKSDLYSSLNVMKLSELDETGVNDVIDFIIDFEEFHKRYLQLRHSREDLVITIEDNRLSRGEIFVCKDKEGHITCVMFTVPGSDGRIKIISQYCHDACSYFKVMSKIKKYFAEMPLTVLRFPEEVKGTSLWQDTSIVANPDGQQLESLVGVETRVFYSADHSLPYGMIKVNKPEKFIDLLVNFRKDISMKLFLITGEERDNIFIEFKNGKYAITFTPDTLSEIKKKEKNLTILKEKDFIEILFRKKRKDDIIMEAFGIPRLPINISLMLD